MKILKDCKTLPAESVEKRLLHHIIFSGILLCAIFAKDTKLTNYYITVGENNRSAVKWSTD